MTDDRLPDLIHAAKQLERLGLHDADLIGARRAARAALAIACATPDDLAPRLDTTATATERAREQARLARVSARIVRPITTTQAMRQATLALRDSIRRTLNRIDSKKNPT